MKQENFDLTPKQSYLVITIIVILGLFANNFI